MHSNFVGYKFIYSPWLPHVPIRFKPPVWWRRDILGTQRARAQYKVAYVAHCFAAMHCGRRHIM